MEMAIGAWSTARGHETGYDEESGEWVYLDDYTLADYERPCAKCRLMPTENGHDACIANLPNVEYACCGHGVEDGYIKLFDGTCVDFDVNCETDIVEYCKRMWGGE
jgi:hypothetical protein